MTNGRSQRPSDVGVGRAIVYGLLVGGAAYLVAVAYGPASTGLRLATAAGIVVAYGGAAHALGVLRRGRTPK